VKKRSTSKRSEISATMAAALAMASEHGGKLTRYVGGYWSFAGVPRRQHDGVPEEYFGTTTIAGLVGRDRMRYCNWREGRGGQFPIEVEIIP